MELSFCVPTYNRAGYLKRCVSSVLANPDSDIEVIVQDNCSTDNTEQLMGSFQDLRLHSYRNSQNIGGVQNIIQIIGRAVGRYIYFLTDDAYLLPEGIGKIKSFISANEPSFFTSDILIYYEKQQKTLNHVFFDRTIDWQTEANKKTMAHVIYSARFLPRVCFKRELLDYELLKEHGNNWYPHILIALQMAQKGPLMYLADPVLGVNVENESFGLPSDMDDTDRGVVNIIKGMQPYLDYEMLEAFIFEFSQGRRMVSDELVELLTPENQNKLKAETRHYKKI